MNIEDMAARLARSADAIRALVAGVSSEQAHWRPDEASWSIVEVVCHLYDEEREDFRQRLGLLLRAPDEPLPGIDPFGWVAARDYNARELEAALEAFLEERHTSIEWLLRLEAPAWDNVNHHPAGFDIRAGDMLAAWVAHDLLHLRQLTELHHAWLAAASEPYNVLYAGPWQDAD